MKQDEIAIELLTQFNMISEKGWIESSRMHNTGIGKTFEDLLDKLEDNTDSPDYKGIEIKTKRTTSNSYTTLFTCKPDGPNSSENSRLREIYGISDEEHGLKTLRTSIFATRKTVFFQKHKFQIDVDRSENKIFLLIFDMNDKLIEKITFWEFRTLEAKLERKLKTLAYIKSETKVDDTGKEHFKFDTITFYKYKSFQKFLDAIENGIIMVDMRIGVYESGTNYGKTHDHGTGFRIKESDLGVIYDEYIIHQVENIEN